LAGPGQLLLDEGKHSIKFGYEYRRTSITQFLRTNYRGKLTFASLADFLSGNVGSGASRSVTLSVTAIRTAMGFMHKIPIAYSRT
jgi:hypothetical protein